MPVPSQGHYGFHSFPVVDKIVRSSVILFLPLFSSLLIGCVRRPTPRTDKRSSSIPDNMITFNGISVYNILNFEFKRYSL